MLVCFAIVTWRAKKAVQISSKTIFGSSSTGSGRLLVWALKAGRALVALALTSFRVLSERTGGNGTI